MSASKVAAIFIRHGQSTANAGDWNQNFAQIALTGLGVEQANALAAQWTFRPSRILVSPFLRAQQTAQPTIERFPDVPVETWDIYEFTHWDKAHWNGSAPEIEPEEVARFFRVADPNFRRGSAETFAEFLGRAEGTLAKLQTLHLDPAEPPILLFSHAHFIQAIRQTILFPHWTLQQKMQHFRTFDDTCKVKNVEQVPAEFDGQQWRLL